MAASRPKGHEVVDPATSPVTSGPDGRGPGGVEKCADVIRAGRGLEEIHRVAHGFETHSRGRAPATGRAAMLGSMASAPTTMVSRTRSPIGYANCVATCGGVPAHLT